MPPSTPRVYVSVTHRDALEGIEAYAASRGGWEILLRPGLLSERQFLRRIGHLDGILAGGDSHELRSRAARRRIPLVCVGGPAPVAGALHVRCDERAVGRLAAQFFLDKGFENLAFVHQVQAPFAVERGEGFGRRADAGGARLWTDLEMIGSDDPARWLFESLDTWLADLPGPLGVFASAMSGAVHIAQTCRRIGRAIPEDVAVLGLGRDELRARLCTPPLSTLDQNDVGVGNKAAQLLDRMMCGERIEPRQVLVQPVAVQPRQSTDVIAVEDPHVRMALSFIRTHAREGINASDVAEAVPASRRVLERSMREILGRTILDEITRIRVETARRLLRETDNSVQQVARMSGFSSPTRMAKVFRRQVGAPPSEYRSGFRSGQ